MFNINVTPETINYAEEITSHRDLGNGQFDAGNKSEQTVGMIGQITVCKALGISEIISDGYDGGYDCLINDIKVDIKTMGRRVYPRPDYVNNIFTRQFSLPSQVYIFTSYHKIDKVLTVCGWIHKDELKSSASAYKIGDIRTRTDGSTFRVKSGLLEVRNDRLHQVSSLEDIKTIKL